MYDNLKREKGVIIATILILSLSLLSGCGKKAPVEKPGVVTINYVFWGDVSERDMNRHWIESFEKKHPDIRVNMIHVTAEGVGAKILTMVAGGDAPDVMYIWPEAFPEFTHRGVYLPLNSFIEEDGLDLNKWFPQLVEPYTYEGRVYGLPRSWHPFVLYYNKNLFDEAGVPYPDESWNWDTVIKWGKELTKDRSGDGRIDQFAIANIPWEIFVWSSGGKIFDKEGTETFFDDPRTIEGFQLARDLIWKYKISPSPIRLRDTMSAVDMFSTGRVAMYGLGIWFVPRFRTIKDFEWDIAIMPKGKTRRTKLVTAGWAISAASKYPRQAWDLVKYLSGPEAQTYQMKIWRDPSGLKDVYEEYIYYEPEKPPKNRRVVIDSIEFGQFSPVFLGHTEIWRKIGEDVDKIFFLKECDVEQVCKDIAGKVRKWLEEQKN
ncbi:MAG: Multiple sugar-binding protein [Syntrophomonadaceae bacterium]|nr:Multiple sugar-binding protein [Bacillota bacterium]